MVDKLEVRIPAPVQFTEEFRYFHREMYGNPKVFRPSKLYIQVGDLREYDYPMLLHLCARHGKGAHKVELLETGGMTYSGMRSAIERVFEMDAELAEVMRLDLAADVPGIPVSWFHSQARVRFKQFACEMGQYSQMGREIQTLYFGKRPNCFRIYDKVGEWRYQYGRSFRGMKEDRPPFEEVYGVPEKGYTLTRVERQMAGGRVPAEVGIVGALPRNAPGFDPFGPMEFVRPGAEAPQMSDYRVMTWLAGMQFRRMIEEGGLQQTRSWVNHRGRNWGRVAERLADFFPAGGTVTKENLLESYRHSLLTQLAR